jgi:glucose-6-phosphate dehydrogenase assembly protein OpcA
MKAVAQLRRPQRSAGSQKQSETYNHASGAETFSLGAPVEIGRIDRELKKLWTEGEGARSRASHINFAVYSEAPGSLEQNTKLISELTKDHACRAIVIAADPRAKKERVEAWLNAHCHVRAGAKQVCSEQISFLLEGASTRLLPSIVFSQLDSDLPLYLWWQAEFAEPMDPQLWAWVDRLIYDSHAWNNFDAQMRLVQTAQHEARQRIVLCDLNWTRLVHFRLAFAQFFDHPASHHHFGKIENVTVEFAYRSTALLWVGWMVAQLGWELADAESTNLFQLTNREGKVVRVELKEGGDAPISAVTARSGDIEFKVRRAECRDLLEVCRGTVGDEHTHQLLPASDDDAVKLVSDELMRGGPHQIYLRAVEKVRRLL